MKRYFLSHSKITNDYYLDYGCFGLNREILGKVDEESLIKKLKLILPLHKQSIIYSEENLENSLKELLKISFGNTRMDFQFKKDLTNLG